MRQFVVYTKLLVLIVFAAFIYFVDSKKSVSKTPTSEPIAASVSVSIKGF
jgi:hypothetical protein